MAQNICAQTESECGEKLAALKGEITGLRRGGSGTDGQMREPLTICERLPRYINGLQWRAMRQAEFHKTGDFDEKPSFRIPPKSCEDKKSVAEGNVIKLRILRGAKKYPPHF